MFGRKKKEEEPVTTLARGLVLLDDIRAYRRKDPEMIESVFADLKKSRFREFYDMWVKARPSAEKIIDMPTKVEGVRQLIRLLSWLKVANRILLIILVLIVALMIVPVWRNALGHDVFSGNGFIYATVFVFLAVISMNVATALDFRIRKKIVAYESATMAQYAPAREKMKECVNKMMRALAKEAKRDSRGRDFYGLVLYFDDYDNIEVVNKWQPKSIGIFKRSYYHYQVVPKL